MLKRQTIASRKVLEKPIADPDTGDQFNSTDGRKLSNSDHTTVIRTSLFRSRSRSRTRQLDGCGKTRGLYALVALRSG